VARVPSRSWWPGVLTTVAIGVAACKLQPKEGGAAPKGEVEHRDGAGRVVAPAVAARSHSGRPMADAGDVNPPDRSPEQRAAMQHLEAKRCRKASCCATGIWPFGPDRRGRRLAVITLASTEPCLLPQKPRNASRRHADPEDDEESPDSNTRHACSEHWLVDVDGARPPIHVSLAEPCNGDHSEVHATVDPVTRTFSYGENSVYSSRQTFEDTVVGLDPLRLIETSHSVQSAEELHDVRWNWDELAGEIKNGYNYCPGKAPPDAGVATDRDDPEIETDSVVIPWTSLPDTFLAEGWRTTGLGGCAARVDGEHGFAIRGGKGSAADSTMKILFASHDTFFVEVTDDHFVSSGKSWVQEDHIEIWTAPSSPECIDPTATSRAQQWGIRIRDGGVFSAFGSPEEKPAVEVARDGKAVRLRVRFAPQTLANRRFTAVYSDSDDGVHQKRLIATSRLEYGNWWTLGEMPDDDTPLTCIIEHGALTPRRPPFP
jgi:hypothetical protein